ncbi:MAG: AAA family ATPase [Myxococcales bacterium]|nr:AAA family ATPase [Myxococcales bacterium]
MTQAATRNSALGVVIHQGHVHSLYRGRERDGTPVIRKRLDAAHYSDAAAERLRREWTILRALAAVPGVVRALEIREEDGELILVLADFGGTSLAAALDDPGLGLRERVAIAIEIAVALAGVHAAGVIHRDIKPRNILVDDARRVQLIDFGIATRIASELAPMVAASQLQGTLAYIAPEQSGRLHRAVDHRADLYALGVTLYELFTGRLPFVADDPAELVHAHLARLPADPRSLAPELPESLAAVILRLLAKSPDDRYRSGFGLAHDLAAIAAALDEGDPERSIALGADDPPLLFQVPDHLYGRDAALELLEGALARTRAGSPEAVFVAGRGGSGKSALYRLLRRRHLGGDVRFAAAAFEASRRDVPYSAIFDALEAGLRELVAAGDELIARWRWSLGKALGGLASAITPRLPALAELLGPEAPRPSEAERYTAEAARHRLHRGLHILVGALARPQAPLVLDLDDVQWIDAASLDLLVELVGELAGEGLFCVLAGDLSGDPEARERVEGALARIGQRARVTKIELMPLEADAIAAMIADTIARPAAEVADLAAVIARKCGGSGFYAAEILRDLHRRKILRFDPQRRRWSYELAAAAALEVSENVVDLLITRASSLDPAALAILQRGACVGAIFEPADVDLEGAEFAALVATLDAAVDERLVEVGAGVIRFAHERVRAAIAATLTPEARAAHHLALARLAAARLGEDALSGAGDDAHLFAAADHYRAALGLVVGDERRSAARITLAAIHRAFGGGAIASARVYAKAVLDLLGDDAWSTGYTIAVDALLHEIECAGSVGDFEAADAATAILLKHARTDEDRAEVHVKRAVVHLARNELEGVMSAAGEAVRILGRTLPRRPSMPALIFGMIRVARKIGRRTAADLLELPALTERRDRLLMQAYGVATGTGFQSDPRVLTQIAVSMLELALERGLHAVVAPAFITYGLAAGAGRGDYAQMEAFGRAGVDLFRRFPSPPLEAMARFLYSGILAPMSHSYRICAADLHEASRLGVESGSLPAAGLAAMAAVSMELGGGVELDRVRADAIAALGLCERAKIGSSEWIIRVDLGLCRALLGEPMEGRLGGEGLDEAVIDGGEDRRIAPTTRYSYLHRRLLRALLFNDLEDAQAVIARADPGIKEALGVFNAYFDYRALRAVALASTAAVGDRRLRRALEGTIRELERPATRCPSNFGALRELAVAELARLRGDGGAAEAYERALAAASAANNPLHEGLVGERAGRYCLGRGLEVAGRAYLVRARRAFARVRAKAVVDRIDADFPGLERRAIAAPPAAMTDVSITLASEGAPSPSSSSSARGDHLLDLASVVKAAQVFAAEIDLDALSGRMMRIVVENAGAERGVLLLVEEGGLVAAAEYSARGDRTIDHERAPIETLSGLPHSLVLRVHRSGRAEIYDDAASDPANAADSYIQRRRLRSALALPLQARGRGVGVVYLENNLTTGVFTEQRLDILQILAVQAAIAVDHAGFFRRLDAAREAAETASLAKSRFLANMSHELRTPLNAILGFAEIIAEDAGDAGLDGVVDDAAKIRRAGAHLLDLVSEILDLTKVEAGHLELERAPIVVAGLIDAVVEIVRGGVEAGGNQLVRIDEGELGIFVGDAMRLRQVLVNLLGNASKFTERGTVTLRARRGDDGSLILRVEDTGIGMSAADITRIFDPFTQVDASSTRRYGGVGLGLTICRRICEQMGGTIAVESEPGVGSVFTVELPEPTALD